MCCVSGRKEHGCAYINGATWFYDVLSDVYVYSIICFCRECVHAKMI